MLWCVFLSKVTLNKNSGTIFGSPFWSSWLSDRSGIVCHELRNSFQWDGESDERPNFMRQNHFVPCDCNNFLFFLNGITTGIAHPPTKKAKVTAEYECGTCVTTNKCTDVRVSLGMVSGSYCRMCYRKQLTTELSATERWKTSRTSAMGCPICKEPICKECWKEGYDKHA
jgi:hypothetical protein